MYPKYFKNKYKRGTNRLANWNYGGIGMYFITICTDGKLDFFGKIENGRMIQNDFGKIVQEEWEKSPIIRPDMNIELFEFIVMPDHFHSIIKIGINQYNSEFIAPTNLQSIPGSRAMHRAATNDNGTTNDNSVENKNELVFIEEIKDIFSTQEIPNDIEELIKLKNIPKNRFGPQSKNLASIIRGFKSSVTTRIKKTGNQNFGWQSRFHEHIIGDTRALNNIQFYIKQNPKNWKSKK